MQFTSNCNINRARKNLKRNTIKFFIWFSVLRLNGFYNLCDSLQTIQLGYNMTTIHYDKIKCISRFKDAGVQVTIITEEMFTH